jgi:hypothetical protein
MKSPKYRLSSFTTPRLFVRKSGASHTQTVPIIAMKK